MDRNRLSFFFEHYNVRKAKHFDVLDIFIRAVGVCISFYIHQNGHLCVKWKLSILLMRLRKENIELK